MTSITWRDEYLTGMRVLDEQHRQLIELLNSLDDAVRRDRGPRVVDAILNDLIAFTQEHCGYEEQVLAVAGCDDLAAHQRRNREWLGAVERFQHEHLTAGRPLSAEFRRSLREWLADHLARAGCSEAPVGAGCGDAP